MTLYPDNSERERPRFRAWLRTKAIVVGVALGFILAYLARMLVYVCGQAIFRVVATVLHPFLRLIGRKGFYARTKDGRLKFIASRAFARES